MPETQFKVLEQKIDDLIKLCAQLNRENVSLKAEIRGWADEREALQERNAQAKRQVEAMLERLRGLETEK
ncbi:MAG: cell division protein ZapB [Halieaceae bacterium]|jgi:cell division protein ZapB|nr:cell division protein ZapB [Halieaceae bacterium]